MERVLGTYISTVRVELIQKQAWEDNLDLPQGDIEWFVKEGTKDTSTLLQDECIPQEDLAPVLRRSVTILLTVCHGASFSFLSFFST